MEQTHPSPIKLNLLETLKLANYRFVEWVDDTGAVISTSNSMNLMVDRAGTVTAHFELYEAPPPALDLPVIAAGGIAALDAVLVAIYLAITYEDNLIYMKRLIGI